MMSRVLFVLLFFSVPVLVFAAEGGSPKDIVPRTLNFILFAALLYYFAAGPIKAFFKQRVDNITSDLNRAQEKRAESEKALELAEQGVAEARKQAEEIVSAAKREAVILRQQIEDSANREMEVLVKQYDDAMHFERRRVEQAVIQEILKELFESDALMLDKNAYADILLKKVA